MHTQKISWFGDSVILACDGNCQKAWGINNRRKIDFDPMEPDDYAFLADDELESAPDNPGTYEGGHRKPANPTYMNKWCARECERSKIFELGEEIILPDFSTRRFNQPWKHQTP
jgi:hypothetical protein